MSVLLIGKMEILEEYLTFELILHQIYDDTTCERTFLQFLRKGIAIKLISKQLTFIQAVYFTVRTVHRVSNLIC